MNAVDPIRDTQKIEDKKVYLKGKSLRDHSLFVVGINVALRISDLLRLTWRDVLDANKKDFKSIKLIEGKTNKKRDIQLNKASEKAFSKLKNCNTFTELQVMIDEYIDYYNNYRYQWRLKKLTPAQYRNQLLAT